MATKYWNHYIKVLPSVISERSMEYVRWQDQHAYVLGKLLLAEGLSKVGLNKDKLNELQYNQFGKPFLNDNIDFNITHSGEYVFCAIGKNISLGIDTEPIREIEFTHFRDTMNKTQWSYIKNSKRPWEAFFRLWTIKESVIKAEQKGLSISLLDIHVKENLVCYNGRKWFIKELDLNNNICVCLATNIQNPKLNLIEIEFTSAINEINKSRQLTERSCLNNGFNRHMYF